MAKGRLILVLAGFLVLVGPVHAQYADDDEPAHGPPRFQAGFEYLFIWLKADTFPALASTGSINDPVPGALGQPGTYTLLGGPIAANRDFSPAGRFSALYWLDAARTFDINGNFFIVGQRTQTFNDFSSGAPGSPLLTHPFFDPVNNVENADPRAIPNVLAGNINFNYQARLLGAELNGRYDVSSREGEDGLHLLFLGGVRYLNLTEKYFSNETVNDLPAGTGNTFVIDDNFTTSNNFVGGQVGAQLKFRWGGNLFFDVFSKVAFGPNYQTSAISGFTSITNSQGVLLGSANQGLYAQPSNIGHRHHTAFSVLPEVDVNFNWEISQHMRLKLGYGFFYISEVIRPGEEIDRRVVIQPLNAPGQVGPALPAVSFHQTSFFAQFINLGVEFMF